MLIMFTVLFMLNGCNMSDEAWISSTSEETQQKTVIYQADWPYYHTIEALDEATDNVFEAELVDITFAVINIRTGEVVHTPSEDAHLMLYTIYEVEVQHVYKGNNGGNMYIAVLGGIQGYNDAYQISLMEECGMLENNVGIPILEGSTPLEMGTEYLFATCDFNGYYQCVPNLKQFAYEIDAENNETSNSVFTYSNIKDYFNVST